MYAKAVEDNLDSCVLRFKTKIGILPFEIIKNNGDYQIVMTQGAFELSPTFDKDITTKMITALGLEEADINEKCPIQIASTGHSKVMIGIKSRVKLNALSPNYNALAELSTAINCNGYFVFTFDSDDKDILTYGRMFAPGIGINEDPVTGNANAPLGGYLIQNKIVDFKEPEFEFKGRQGEKTDRLGVINIKVKIEDNEPTLIQIKGDAVVVFRTEIMA